jgi:lysophospholipase L1-like esterase
MKRTLLIFLYIICSVFYSRIVAQDFDNLPTPGEEKVIDNTPDSIAKALMARPAPGSTRVGTNPVLFLIGNSTMRNGTLGNGNNGQWGWGYFFPKYFNANKITVENQALGGMSTRTFYTDLWPAIRQALKPGDWVIVSIGHNDSADFFDQRRARGVIPGVDTDTMIVGFNQRIQKQDTVYSYGNYLRKYIYEIREKGANPILMSLTPRDALDDRGKIVRKPQTEWAAYIAATESVPFIDLNEISGQKLDRFSRWKQLYHFLGDHIHTSKFGAELNANSAAMGIFNSNNPQLKSLKAMMMVDIPFRYITTSGKPRLFFTGDSTVKNADKEDDGMWGWASQAATVFDESKITLINAGRAGRSTRTFIKEGLWERVYDSLQPGDFVTIQFGHNDICPITDAKGRGVIPGTKDTLHVYHMDDGSYEVVYSFGWYLKKMIDDTREKGATPILVSLTPRNEWPGGKIERRDDTYGKWYREVVKETGVEFIDMHNISADFLDKKFAMRRLSDNKEKAREQIAKIKERAGIYFKQDHTHASKLGAQMNAQSFAKGLRASSSELAKYLKK